MNIVNDYAGQADTASAASLLSPLFIKNLRIMAISLIVIGLLTTGIFLTIALVTANLPFISFAIPGLLLIGAAIILILKVREKEEALKQRIIHKIPLQAIIQEVSRPVDQPEVSSRFSQSVRETRQLFQEVFPKKLESPSSNIKLYESSRGVRVAFAKGPIEFSVFPIQQGTNAVVFNDADPAYRRGGSGTNLSLTEATSNLSWRSSVGRGLDYMRSDEELSDNIARVGLMTVGNWVSSIPYHQRWLENRPHPLLTPEMKKDPSFREANWTLLGQMVGPRCSDFPDFKKDAFPIMRKLYSDAICQSVRIGLCSIVQVPLISSGEKAPTDSDEKLEWRALAAKAFLESICDLEKQASSYSLDLSNIIIAIIEQDTVACSEYLY